MFFGLTFQGIPKMRCIVRLPLKSAGGVRGKSRLFPASAVIGFAVSLALIFAHSTCAVTLSAIDAFLPLLSASVGCEFHNTRSANAPTRPETALFAGASLLLYVSFNGSFDDTLLPDSCQATVRLNLDVNPSSLLPATFLRRKHLTALIPSVQPPCDNQLVFVRPVLFSDSAFVLRFSAQHALNVSGCSYPGVELSGELFQPLTPWPTTVINPQQPKVSAIQATAPSGVYHTDDQLLIVVRVLKQLVITPGMQTARLILNSGGSAFYTSYRSSEHGTEFLFVYRVLAGETTTKLDVIELDLGDMLAIDTETLKPLDATIPVSGSFGSLSYSNATLGIAGSQIAIVWTSPDVIPPPGYDPNALPHLFCPYSALSCKRDTKTRVNAVVHFVDIWEVDSASETFAARLNVILMWHEPRFKGILKDQLDIIPMDEAFLAKIWNPEFSIVNVRVRSVDVLRSVGRIYPDGRVEMVQTIQHQFYSTFDSRNFPFDTQKLFIDLELRDYPYDHLIFDAVSRDNRLMEIAEEKLTKLNNPTHSFSGVSQHAGFSADLTNLRFSRLRTTFQAVRDPSYTVSLLLFPLAVVIVYACGLFLINPASDSRFLSAGASLSGVLAFTYTIQTNLPKEGRLNRLSFFLFWTLASVFLSFVYHIAIRHALQLIASFKKKLSEMENHHEAAGAHSQQALAVEHQIMASDRAGPKDEKQPLTSAGGGDLQGGTSAEHIAHEEEESAFIELGRLAGCIIITEETLPRWEKRFYRLEAVVKVMYLLMQIVAVTLILTLDFTDLT